MRTPFVTEICPTCNTTFTASPNPSRNSNTVRYKTCPNGHTHSTNQLTAYRKKMSDTADIKSRLFAVGIRNDTESLRLALVWMLDGHDKAMAVLPDGSQAKALVAGAFGQTVELARKMVMA